MHNKAVIVEVWDLQDFLKCSALCKPLRLASAVDILLPNFFFFRTDRQLHFVRIQYGGDKKQVVVPKR